MLTVSPYQGSSDVLGKGVKGATLPVHYGRPHIALNRKHLGQNRLLALRPVKVDLSMKGQLKEYHGHCTLFQ